MYYLGSTLFIAGICMPISYPEIGGVICIIMAGPFDCQKCTIFDPTISYLLPGYWQDVVSTSEVQSWFNLGRGSVYATFLSVTGVTGVTSSEY